MTGRKDRLQGCMRTPPTLYNSKQWRASRNRVGRAGTVRRRSKDKDPQDRL